jgi:hypothetical protein
MGASRSDEYKEHFNNTDAPSSEIETPVVIENLLLEKGKISNAEDIINSLKKQVIDIIIESNRRHTENQAKIQNYEGVNTIKI